MKNDKKSAKMLISYIRKNMGGIFTRAGDVIVPPTVAKKGVMIAVPVGKDRVRIGQSLCNFSKGDKFNGNDIAIARALSGSEVRPARSMIGPLEKFIGRARRYYKDREVEVTFQLKTLQ